MSVFDAALLAGLRMGTMAWHRGKTLYVGPRKGQRVGRWMVYAEGTAYAYLQHRSRRARFVPDYEALPDRHQPQDPEALLRLASRHAITSIAGSPVEIADFVRSTGVTMPSVRVVFNCGYFAEDNLPRYSDAFPNATVVDIYGANEGTYGLPLSAGRFILNCTRIFYSFAPLTGPSDTLSLADAGVGMKYRLCVTTPGGLWNYVTDDVVELLSLSPPVIRLCGRAQRTLSLAGEIVTEDEVVRAVRGVGIATDRYLLTSEGSGYVLHIDGDTADPLALDAELRRLNPQYAAAVQAGKLQRLTVRRSSIALLRDQKPSRIAGEQSQLGELLLTPACE